MPTKEVGNYVPKLKLMYEKWRKLKKIAFKRTKVQLQKENKFVIKFDILLILLTQMT